MNVSEGEPQLSTKVQCQYLSLFTLYLTLSVLPRPAKSTVSFVKSPYSIVVSKVRFNLGERIEALSSMKLLERLNIKVDGQRKVN